MKMKSIQAFFLAGMVLFSSTALADPRPDGFDVVADVAVVRPVTLVGTIAGTALFVGLLPFTALVSIPAPHKGVQLTADTLVLKPAQYTFSRRAGDFGWNTR